MGRSVSPETVDPEGQWVYLKTKRLEVAKVWSCDRRLRVRDSDRYLQFEASQTAARRRWRSGHPKQVSSSEIVMKGDKTTNKYASHQANSAILHCPTLRIIAA